MTTDQLCGFVMVTFGMVVPVAVIGGNCVIHWLRRGRWHWLLSEIGCWN